MHKISKKKLYYTKTHTTASLNHGYPFICFFLQIDSSKPTKPHHVLFCVKYIYIHICVCVCVCVRACTLYKLDSLPFTISVTLPSSAPSSTKWVSITKCKYI